ncbi:Ig-like domain-containing protein [Streptomyces sp. AK04-4c]|uniref:Ig-like domain-containing protein n=1 Tax=Streptomyces sp. AK04-4c TaxID=3028651 RepID=UPI0029A5FCEF|nr:Ig-like domain-containing protein [Streptomyces sp. AK04-4c]MDX3683418.1 Ig-like domain-containing protein [Streptomyces sp. AK04-4c]
MRITPRRGRLVVATALAAVLGLASPAWAVPSSTTVTATPQSAEVGTQVQLAATVDCPADAAGGLGVTFFDGNILLDTVPVNANGQASHTTTFTTVGSHTITAAYNGTAECDASSSTTTVQVTSAPTPPGPTPGFCLLACGGLINFSTGDIRNTVNIYK